jgi:hypothetical protein
MRPRTAPRRAWCRALVPAATPVQKSPVPTVSGVRTSAGTPIIPYTAKRTGVKITPPPIPTSPATTPAPSPAPPSNAASTIVINAYLAAMN